MRGLRRRPGLPRRRFRTTAPSARTMARPSVEELRLDDVAPPVDSCLSAALHRGTPLGRANALAGVEDFTGLDGFMARVNFEGTCVEAASAPAAKSGGGGHRGKITTS